MTPTSPIDDAALVAAAAEGGEHAFRTLYRAYARPVFWLAHGLVGNTADAEDMMQETFLVAWRKLPGLQLVGTSLLPWLATICRFQCANRIRQRQRDRAHGAGPLAESLPDTVDVERQVVAQSLVDRILEEVTRLSALDREIFLLCAAEGYSYAVAAEHLGVSHGVVRNRLSRVRTQLRASVEEES